jgi:hypothetical protein
MAAGDGIPPAQIVCGRRASSDVLKEAVVRVIVKLYATLTQDREGVKAGKPIEFELPDGATVQDLRAETPP